MTEVRDIVDLVHSLYPTALAEQWDSVGMIAGSWNWQVRRVLVSVDIDNQVLDEAIAIGAQMVISHHPLMLPRHSLVSQPYKLKTANRAVCHGIALMNAHTNADHATNGVSDALAAALGVVDTAPLVPLFDEPGVGVGRIGRLLAPCTVAELAQRISASIPNARVRTAGSLEQQVSRVAVCGGSGDAFLGAAAHADVYVTSDLRHHPVAEHLEAGGCPVIEINHVAAEAQWLPTLAALLAPLGIDVLISKQDTAHWN